MKASLYIRFRDPDGKKYITTKPAFAANGRIRPGVAIVRKSPQKVEGYTYVLRCGGTWQTVGDDPTLALAALDRRNHDLKAVKLGLSPSSPAPVAPPVDRRRLMDVGADFLVEVRANRKPKTWDAYRFALGYFFESCGKVFLDEIDRKDLLDFKSYLRDKQGLGKRTVFNKFSNIVAFLRAQGITGLVGKSDYPEFNKKKPKAYTAAEMNQFFSVCTPKEKVWFEFFLCTGEREQEVAHTVWADINFDQHIVTVSAKPDWSPKAYKEREIPVPQTLTESLKSIKPTNARGLIFPNSAGNPKLDFLKVCKAIAERAGFDRDDFYCHKFRATFATWHLQSGVDIKTVQDWLGHESITTTSRYLQRAQGAAVQAKVNATFNVLGGAA